MAYHETNIQKINKLLNNPKEYSRKVIPFIKSVLTPYFRDIVELLGIQTLSKPYPGHKELLEILGNMKNGFFVQCGGNEGYFQDPTYYLEKFLGWSGIIAEPLPIYKLCQRNRSKSKVYNEAVTSFEFKEKEIELIDVNFMSVVKGSIENEKEWIKKGQDTQNINARSIIVPARPIQNIIDEYAQSNGYKQIDLFVADIEGYELEALKGIDFNKNKPNFFLIEIHTEDRKIAIDNFLSQFGYKLLKEIGNRDFIYSKN